jgi:hypothetical protein
MNYLLIELMTKDLNQEAVTVLEYPTRVVA